MKIQISYLLGVLTGITLIVAPIIGVIVALGANAASSDEEPTA